MGTEFQLIALFALILDKDEGNLMCLGELDLNVEVIYYFIEREIVLH